MAKFQKYALVGVAQRSHAVHEAPRAVNVADVFGGCVRRNQITVESRDVHCEM